MAVVARLLVVLSLVLGSAETMSVAFAADPSVAPLTSLPARPGDSDLFGMWSGTITVEGLAEPFDGGYIAIERLPGERLGVTVGPEAGVRYTGARLERTERGLRFEVTLPAFETRLLVYDIEFTNGDTGAHHGHAAMTGTVTFVKHRLTKPGVLEFVRR